jgi:hypothetical protein
MKNSTIRNSWKNPMMKSKLALDNPIGEPILNLDKIVGGANRSRDNWGGGGAGCGWLGSISGECNKSGKSCNPFYGIEQIEDDNVDFLVQDVSIVETSI